VNQLLVYLALFLAPSTSGTYLVIAKHLNGIRSDTARVTVAMQSPVDTGWAVHYSFDDRVLGTVPPGFFAGTPPRSGTTVTNEQAKFGTQSARLSIQEGTDGWGSWGGTLVFPRRAVRGETIRVRAFFWIPAEFRTRPPGSSERNKFLRMTTNSLENRPYSNDLAWNSRPMTNAQPYSWCYEGGGYTDFYRNLGSPIQSNAWESIEWAMVLDNVSMQDGGMARVLVWKNGILVADIQDVITINRVHGWAFQLRFFTYWNDKAPKDEYLYVDEITITTKTPTLTDDAGNPYLGTGPHQNALP